MNYRTQRNYENLEKVIFEGVGNYDIPKLFPQDFEGSQEFIPFNSAKTAKKCEGKTVHFFIDDYQFARIWNNIDVYIPMLQKFDYVLTPDFSTYTDFPKAIQIYNHYRKHWVGAYMQMVGIKVIPTISWSTEDSFEWCFDGEPEGGTLAISSIGVMNSEHKKRLFLSGYNEMVKRLKPEKILFYGNIPEECTGNIIHVKPYSDKFKEAKIDGW